MNKDIDMTLNDIVDEICSILKIDEKLKKEAFKHYEEIMSKAIFEVSYSFHVSLVKLLTSPVECQFILQLYITFNFLSRATPLAGLPVLCGSHTLKHRFQPMLTLKLKATASR